MKVLVIEDDAVDRKLAREVLLDDGHSVREGNGASDAFVAIAADVPDVILLDLRLPGMDGLALAHCLKSEPATAGIRIVAVTAYPERYPLQALLEAGCEACIVKPLDTRGLARLIEQAATAPPEPPPCKC